MHIGMLYDPSDNIFRSTLVGKPFMSISLSVTSSESFCLYEWLVVQATVSNFSLYLSYTCQQYWGKHSFGTHWDELKLKSKHLKPYLLF